MKQSLIDRIAEHEGFKPRPYPDPLTGGAPWTFGHGLTYLTKEESLMVVHHRLITIHEKISKRKPFFPTLPLDAQFVLMEMAYQMGIGGLMRFKNTWNHLEHFDFKAAAEEMLDSTWAREQTSNRAIALSKIMSNVSTQP